MCGRRIDACRRAVGSALAELPEAEHRGGVEAVLQAVDVVPDDGVLLGLPDRQDGDVLGDEVLEGAEVFVRRGAVRLGGGLGMSEPVILLLL